MKSAILLLCVVSTAVGAPFNFGGFEGQAGGAAQGTVTQGLNFNPYSGTSSQIINTGSDATGTSTNGAPNFSNSHASNLQGPGGASLSNTGAFAVQPGGFGAGHGFGGSPFGFGGFGGEASGASQGKVTQGQTFGPQGHSQIISTGSNAKGNSINGAPNFSNAHATNQQRPGGVSVSNTGASAIQPGFNSGHFGRGRFGGFGGYGGF